MRENRPYGSEGGGGESLSLPLSMISISLRLDRQDMSASSCAQRRNDRKLVRRHAEAALPDFAAAALADVAAELVVG
jgi:hypothetical protein